MAKAKTNATPTKLAKKPAKTKASNAKKASNTKAKATNAKKPAAKKAAAAKTTDLAIRRPDPNLPPSKARIDYLTDSILTLIPLLEEYAANLRALDRQRHNGVGLKRLGFIEAALRLSTLFPQYFPHWLSTAKFQNDLDIFTAIRSLVEACRSLEEKAWNINILASDMVYTDALEYYSQVQDAAERRIDSAESIFHELFEFFRRSPMEGGEPTEKEVLRDTKALLKGKKGGKIVIKNIKPKMMRGTREVIDETFKDSVEYKETEEGSITE